MGQEPQQQEQEYCESYVFEAELSTICQSDICESYVFEVELSTICQSDILSTHSSTSQVVNNDCALS